ncbi:MAG: bacteriophage holin [Vicinamibacteria bacterium]|nr:bacteriophage holin [Vicinamibacteria bacterium]
MRLNVRAFALTGGIVWGLTVCLATLWLLAFGYEGGMIRVLDHFYFGYSYSVVGAFVGLFWGFIDGAIFAALFAWLYNRLVR